MPSKGTPLEITPSERSNGSARFRKQSSSSRGKGKGKGRRVKFEEAFPIQEVYRGDPGEKKSHMNVLPVWAVLDCLAQACETRGRKAGDDRKDEAVEEKYPLTHSVFDCHMPSRRTFGDERSYALDLLDAAF